MIIDVFVVLGYRGVDFGPTSGPPRRGPDQSEPRVDLVRRRGKRVGDQHRERESNSGSGESVLRKMEEKSGTCG